MTVTMHPMGEEYLQRLGRAARVLPRGQREELLAEVRSHLEAGLPPDASEAEARNVLDALGSPADIVAAARPDHVPTRRGAREVLALLFLVTGLPPVLGWLRWRGAARVLAAVVGPAEAGWNPGVARWGLDGVRLGFRFGRLPALNVARRCHGALRAGAAGSGRLPVRGGREAVGLGVSSLGVGEAANWRPSALADRPVEAKWTKRGGWLPLTGRGPCLDARGERRPRRSTPPRPLPTTKLG